MSEILEFTTQLARSTGNLLLDYYRPGGIDTQIKADRTAVTEADLAADNLIHETVLNHFPTDGLLTEEAETTYPEDKSVVWVIDPLDGTTNFSLGLHYWGVAIARLVDGVPETAALYFPVLDELFSAQRGHGATLNGERLETRKPNDKQPFTFFSCCSRTHRGYNVGIKYKTRILGSAAYGLVSVARGSAALAFEVTPKVWDFSASWLVTQEAGGLIQSLNDEQVFPLVPGTDYGNKPYPILAAATPKLQAEALNKIKLRV
jgi:myo-inositol-1(or 4)-monophosphatase